MLLFDASSLINLANGGVLEITLSLPGSIFLVCSAAQRETISIRSQLEELIESGRLRFIDDEEIPASDYLAIKDKHDLGDGESECMAYALHNNCSLVIDDLAARTIAIKMFGDKRVTGSIGLLRECVEYELIDREAAYNAYKRMKEMGGFLPNMTIEEMFPE